jgi:hypothetical protein
MSFTKRFFLSVLLSVLPAAGFSQEFKELRSEHFVVSYAPGVSESYARKVKDEAEHFYRDITQEFNLIREKLWLWDNRARIFIAADREDFLRRFRCQSWSAACVNYRDKTIYTFPGQTDFSSILAHEMTHIIFREYIGYGRLPLWLDEGMAMYIQYKESSSVSSLVSYTRRMVAQNQYMPFSEIQKVYSLRNDSGGVNTFYVQSFSMVYFLVSRYGAQYFKPFLYALKNGSGVEDALRKSFHSISDMSGFERLWKDYYQK